THGSHERDLSRFGVGHEESVRALGLGRAPEPVPRIEAHAVLGVFHARAHGERLRILRDQRVHVLIHEVFKTCAITRVLTPQQWRKKGKNGYGMSPHRYFSSVMMACCFPRISVSVCVRSRRLNRAMPGLYGFTVFLPSGVVDCRSPSSR